MSRAALPRIHTGSGVRKSATFSSRPKTAQPAFSSTVLATPDAYDHRVYDDPAYICQQARYLKSLLSELKQELIPLKEEEKSLQARFGRKRPDPGYMQMLEQKSAALEEKENLDAQMRFCRRVYCQTNLQAIEDEVKSLKKNLVLQQDEVKQIEKVLKERTLLLKELKQSAAAKRCAELRQLMNERRGELNALKQHEKALSDELLKVSEPTPSSDPATQIRILRKRLKTAEMRSDDQRMALASMEKAYQARREELLEIRSAKERRIGRLKQERNGNETS